MILLTVGNIGDFQLCDEISTKIQARLLDMLGTEQASKYAVKATLLSTISSFLTTDAFSTLFSHPNFRDVQESMANSNHNIRSAAIWTIHEVVENSTPEYIQKLVDNFVLDTICTILGSISDSSDTKLLLEITEKIITQNEDFIFYFQDLQGV